MWFPHAHLQFVPLTENYWVRCAEDEHMNDLKYIGEAWRMVISLFFIISSEGPGGLSQTGGDDEIYFTQAHW